MLSIRVQGLLQAAQVLPQAISSAFIHTTTEVGQPVAKAAAPEANSALFKVRMSVLVEVNGLLVSRSFGPLRLRSVAAPQAHTAAVLLVHGSFQQFTA